jgi:hypothetical protein
VSRGQGRSIPLELASSGKKLLQDHVNAHNLQRRVDRSPKMKHTYILCVGQREATRWRKNEKLRM